MLSTGFRALGLHSLRPVSPLSAGSVVVILGLSCPRCGIFLHQGSHPCLLHRQVDFYPLPMEILAPREVPVFGFWKIAGPGPSVTNSTVCPLTSSQVAALGPHGGITAEGRLERKSRDSGGRAGRRAASGVCAGSKPSTWAPGPHLGVGSRTSAPRMGAGTGEARELRRLMVYQSSRTERKMEALPPRLRRKEGAPS